MESSPKEVVAGLLAAVVDYDIEACDRLLASAVADMEPLSLIRDVVSPLLREAGNRWHRGEFAVVQEHMISGVVRRQLSYALDRYLMNCAAPSVLFTTLSGERHEMGALMGAVLAASEGFHSIYLGPDLPVSEISLFCTHRPVQALALSVVTDPDVIDAPGQLAELRSAIPSPTEIWVSGHASSALAKKPLPPGICIIRDLGEFLDRLAALKSGSQT